MPRLPHSASLPLRRFGRGPAPRWSLAAAMLGAPALSGCKPAGPEAAPSPVAQTSPATSTAAVAQSGPERGTRREIATGELVAGTDPGDFDWRPELEPLPFHIKLGDYSIDALPYPNDPATPPRTTKSVEEAAQWCGQQGGRLCTELEWERACRGPEQHPFAGGKAPATCPGTAGCESAFGVFALGARPEWTASHFGPASEFHGRPVLRGKPSASSDRLDERCSLRHPMPDDTAEAAAVRCCYGAPNAARVEEPVDYPVFERPNLSPSRLRKLLDANPRTASLSKDLVLFADPEATNTVISRGPGDRKGFDFSTGPLLWSPTVGARFLVLGGKSGKDTSFVLAYYALPGDEYLLASSYIMENEVGPVTFAYSDSIRPRLHFSTCWGCPGETGKLLFRKPGRVTILQP